MFLTLFHLAKNVYTVACIYTMIKVMETRIKKGKVK